MKNILTLVIVAAFSLIVYSQFTELAYKLGFAELKMVAVLQNEEKMKVKCDAYALGFFDNIKIENKFQQCINDYEAAGYKLLSRLDS